jgi:hypothetical protein
MAKKDLKGGLLRYNRFIYFGFGQKNAHINNDGGVFAFLAATLRPKRNRLKKGQDLRNQRPSGPNRPFFLRQKIP